MREDKGHPKGWNLKLIVFVLMVTMYSQITGSVWAQSYKNATVVVDISCGDTYKYGDMITVKVQVENADDYEAYGEGTFIAIMKSYTIEAGALGVMWHWTYKSGYKKYFEAAFDEFGKTITAEPPKQCEELLKVYYLREEFNALKDQNETDLQAAKDAESVGIIELGKWVIADGAAGAAYVLELQFLSHTATVVEAAEKICYTAASKVERLQGEITSIQEDLINFENEKYGYVLDLDDAKSNDPVDEVEIAQLEAKITRTQHEIDTRKEIQDEFINDLWWANLKKTTADIILSAAIEVHKAKEAVVAITKELWDKAHANLDAAAGRLEKYQFAIQVAEKVLFETNNKLKGLEKELDNLFKWFIDLGLDPIEVCGFNN
jgi:hypothetical protein